MKNPDSAPALPEGIEALTFPQMYAEVLTYFAKLYPDEDATVIQQRAWKAVNTIIESGIVSWWGMSDEGLPTYVPNTRISIVVRSQS